MLHREVCPHAAVTVPVPEESVAPPQRCGAALINDSRKQVAEVFKEWVPPKNDWHYDERGGQVRAARLRKLTQAPSAHVESSFTGEQRAYIGTAIAALNMLTNGRLLVRKGDVQPMADRVVEVFNSQSLHQAHFGDAVARGIFGVYDDFSRYYPNLLPALRAMHTAGGTEGVEFAQWATRRELARHVGYKEVDEPRQYMDRGASAQLFTGMHPRIPVPYEPYEVHCPGESFAKSMVRQGKRAAELVSEQLGIHNSYDPQLEGLYDESRFTLALDRHIEQLSER